MKLYVVFKTGVYRHECCGVFSTKRKAIAEAKGFAKIERDDYHTFKGYCFVLDTPSNHIAKFEVGNIDEGLPIFTVHRSGQTITVEPR